MQIVREFKPTHIHAFNELYALNFIIGLMLVRIPMVYRAGDEPTVHNWAWRAVWRFIARRGSQFVANSQFVARSLCSNGIQRDLITVIYNAPPGRVGNVDGHLSLLLPTNVRAIVFIGQISEHKGIHLLVDAFRDVAYDYPDVRLLIAGRISDWRGDSWGRRLRELVANDPIIRDRVKFLGYVEDVSTLLALSEIHVTPSLFNDPSPNVVMEAKLAARPSVVFPCGGLPELIEHGVDGFVCHEASVSALIEALRSYLEDTTLVQRHGNAAFVSLKRLGIPDFRKRWLEAYLTAAQLKISK
jgi:glycosyltransferase involved in cell wall biosynthesis